MTVSTENPYCSPSTGRYAVVRSIEVSTIRLLNTAGRMPEVDSIAIID
ncbi:hypothetical protein [Rhodococcus opacus]|nr:hypothetical protein [Rhodococcus opacus]